MTENILMIASVNPVLTSSSGISMVLEEVQYGLS